MTRLPKTTLLRSICLFIAVYIVGKSNCLPGAITPQHVEDYAPPPHDYDLTDEEKASSGEKKPCSVVDEYTNYDNHSESESTTPSSGLTGRVSKTLLFDRWKAVNIYLEYLDYSEKEIRNIHAAAKRLNDILSPCGVPVGIWPPDHEPTGDYLYIHSDGGCRSDTGRKGGRQELSLERDYCTDYNQVIHEMMHALGFFHEHTRPDRDDYITVHWENINFQDIRQFFKKLPLIHHSYYVPYNTRSIMHYEGTDFAKEGTKSITAKDGGEVGYQNDLAETDVELIKRRYCSPLGKK